MARSMGVDLVEDNTDPAEGVVLRSEPPEFRTEEVDLDELIQDEDGGEEPQEININIRPDGEMEPGSGLDESTTAALREWMRLHQDEINQVAQEHGLTVNPRAFVDPAAIHLTIPLPLPPESSSNNYEIEQEAYVANLRDQIARGGLAMSDVERLDQLIRQSEIVKNIRMAEIENFRSRHGDAPISISINNNPNNLDVTSPIIHTYSNIEAAIRSGYIIRNEHVSPEGERTIRHAVNLGAEIMDRDNVLRSADEARANRDRQASRHEQIVRQVRTGRYVNYGNEGYRMFHSIEIGRAHV